MATLRRALSTASMLCLSTLPGSSVSRGGDADWLTYNRTLAGDRFSPLKEIDRSNVLLGVASGMKSPMWPGGAQQSRILVYGMR